MGCDGRWKMARNKYLCFNPRTHMGCDETSWKTAIPFQSFNPRTHMGCDVHTYLLQARKSCFNPRTHMGCDANAKIKGNFYVVSIHAPTWGATSSYMNPSGDDAFQSTHPHGVRRYLSPVHL